MKQKAKKAQPNAPAPEEMPDELLVTEAAVDAVFDGVPFRHLRLMPRGNCAWRRITTPHGVWKSEVHGMYAPATARREELASAITDAPADAYATVRGGGTAILRTLDRPRPEAFAFAFVRLPPIAQERLTACVKAVNRVPTPKHFETLAARSLLHVEDWMRRLFSVSNVPMFPTRAYPPPGKGYPFHTTALPGSVRHLLRMAAMDPRRLLEAENLYLEHAVMPHGVAMGAQDRMVWGFLDSRDEVLVRTAEALHAWVPEELVPGSWVHTLLSYGVIPAPPHTSSLALALSGVLDPALPHLYLAPHPVSVNQESFFIV